MDDGEIAAYQRDTLEYAVGDDLVVGGVVYDRNLWVADGEGGVMTRAEWAAEHPEPLWACKADRLAYEAACDGLDL